MSEDKVLLKLKSPDAMARLELSHDGKQIKVRFCLAKEVDEKGGEVEAAGHVSMTADQAVAAATWAYAASSKDASALAMQPVSVPLGIGAETVLYGEVTMHSMRLRVERVGEAPLRSSPFTEEDVAQLANTLRKPD